MSMKIFLRISGENEELADAELRAVLESEEIEYRVLKRLPQVILLSSFPESLAAVSRKCAMVREGGRMLFVRRAKAKEILDAVEEIQPFELRSLRNAFSVRIRRIQGSSREIRTELEGEIGRRILQKRPDLKVDLDNPEHAFIGLLAGDYLVFGLKMIEVKARSFKSRRPRDRPFFHPSSMSPILARVMVNLSRCRDGELLLDPFCGTGGILMEAGLTGRRVLGSDVKREMAAGTLRNLRQSGVAIEGLAISEVGCLPFVQADSIATDSPYGKLSTTFGDEPESVIQRFLNSAAQIVPRGRHVCLGSQTEIELRDMAEKAGFKIVERLQVREHRSLTRIILVLKREGSRR